MFIKRDRSKTKREFDKKMQHIFSQEPFLREIQYCNDGVWKVINEEKFLSR